MLRVNSAYSFHILICTLSELPFTSFTFTQAIVLSKEIFSIETGDFFPWVNVTEYLHTSCVSPSGNKLQFSKSHVIYIQYINKYYILFIVYTT